jgi:hypothetical protein
VEEKKPLLEDEIDLTKADTIKRSQGLMDHPPWT